MPATRRWRSRPPSRAGRRRSSSREMASYVVCASTRHSIRVVARDAVRARCRERPAPDRRFAALSRTRVHSAGDARVRHRARVSSLRRHGGLFDSQPAQEANHASAHGLVARAADSLRHRSRSGQHAPSRTRHPHSLGAAHRAGGLLGARRARLHGHAVDRGARVAHAHSRPGARCSWSSTTRSTSSTTSGSATSPCGTTCS